MPSTPVRLGLIGAGRWGQVYLRTVQSLGDRCRVTHVASRNPAAASLLPSTASLHADWRTVIEADCDAVIIATPPKTHAQILEACLKLGKPCLVEKPLCLDVDTAERLHRQVEDSRVPVLVDHTHLFHPAYTALKRSVRDGGERVRAVMSEGMALGPFRTHTTALWDWGPHDVSLCLDMLGTMPMRVAALAGPPSPDGDPELLSLRLEFAQEVCAWIQVGRLSLTKRRQFSIATDAHLYLFDDLATEPLTVASVEWLTRYRGGVPDKLAWQPVPLDTSQRPMAHVVNAFVDGLVSGTRHGFGTSLACDVVRVLARCEAAQCSPIPWR